MTQQTEIASLEAEAQHARQRLALYRRRTNLGRGDLRRLAELERVLAGATDRLARTRSRQAATDLRPTTTPGRRP